MIEIMQWFIICIFHFSKAVIKILLCAAAATAMDDMGAFPASLLVCNTVLFFCDLHEKNRPFFSFKMRNKDGFHAPNGDICFVYFCFGKEMVIENL